MSVEQIDEVGQMLKINDPKRSGNVRVESDILEPQQSSQSYATFNIRTAGILSNDSRLQLPLYATNANTRLTCYGGAMAKIRRALLRTRMGGITIAESEDIDFLWATRNHFKSQEHRDKVARYKTGAWNVFKYGVEGAFTGKYVLGGLDTAGTDQEVRFRVGQGEANATSFSISLKDLFPELFPFSIPLYLIEGGVQLFLEFATDHNDYAVSTDGNNANIGDIEISLSQLKFVSDHVFMDSSVMDRLRGVSQTDKGLVIPFANYNLIKLTRSAPAEPVADAKTDTTYTNSIGMNGLTIKHILIHNQAQSADGTPLGYQKLSGKYASSGDLVGVGGQQIQIQLNNENYYTQNLEVQEFYPELEGCFNLAPSIPAPVYSTMGGVNDGEGGDTGNKYVFANRNLIADVDVFTGVAQSTLSGSANIIGINFAHNKVNNGMNGLTIGKAPTQLTYVRSFTNGRAQNLLSRVYVCVSRMMSIRNGQVLNNQS
jgi:hypothetical protein